MFKHLPNNSTEKRNESWNFPFAIFLLLFSFCYFYFYFYFYFFWSFCYWIEIFYIKRKRRRGKFTRGVTLFPLEQILSSVCYQKNRTLGNVIYIFIVSHWKSSVFFFVMLCYSFSTSSQKETSIDRLLTC